MFDFGGSQTHGFLIRLTTADTNDRFHSLSPQKLYYIEVDNTLLYVFQYLNQVELERSPSECAPQFVRVRDEASQLSCRAG